MQTKNPHFLWLSAAMMFLSQASACGKTPSRETSPLLGLSPDCQLVVFWEGPSWQRDRPKALLERIRALPAWRLAWNARHDAWLETSAAAAFSLSGQGESPLLFLGKRDDQGTVAASPSCAETQPELARMLAPRSADALMRFAASLPPSLRGELGRGKVAYADALAAILRVSGILEWGEKPRVSLRFELSNTPAARDLAEGLETYRKEAKRHPDLLLLGLGPHLESLSISPRQAVVTVTLSLGNDEAMALVDEIGARLSRKKQP